MQLAGPVPNRAPANLLPADFQRLSAARPAWLEWPKLRSSCQHLFFGAAVSGNPGVQTLQRIEIVLLAQCLELAKGCQFPLQQNRRMTRQRLNCRNRMCGDQ